MANAGGVSPEIVLDVCRHGRGPSQFCPMCDRAEVGFESGRRWPGTIDLRDEPGVDVLETGPRNTHPHCWARHPARV